MPEKNKKEGEAEPVKVVDRRRFTDEGERRPGVETPPALAPAPSATPPPSPGPAPESEAARRARQDYDRQRPPRDYKVDFETLVVSLSTSAMYQLGLVEDPTRGPIPADPEAARHTIDMLAVIQEKTRGNLTPQEQRLLEQVLYELRLAYVAVTAGKKPGVPQAGG